MKEKTFFVDLLNNTEKYLKLNFNKEYNSKNELKKMEKANIPQFDITMLNEYLNQNNILNILINEIENIKTEYLYKSSCHGISHNIKVLIYAFIICREQNLNYRDTKIVLDSCKYHDIGRINDFEDEHHGERSSNKIDKIIEDDNFYNDINNKNLLKATMELHSKNDNIENNIATKYQVNLEELKPIYSILKDSDALDRIRLSISLPFLCDLKTSFLRTQESKKLVKFASQLNFLYYKIIVKNINISKVKSTTK